MSVYGEHSRFYRVISPDTIETGTLEFPSEFVKDHGKHLSVYAHLKVPTGSVSKIELRRCEGRILLDKGWRDFMDKYSISRWQILVFKYKGISRFHVQIFDVSDSEIKYPVSSTRTRNMNSGEPEVGPVKEEESQDDDEVMDAGPPKIFDVSDSEGKYPVSSTRTSNMNSGEPEVGSVEEEGSQDDDEIMDAGPPEVKAFESINPAFSMTEGTRGGAASARSRVVRKGKAFESQSPYFCLVVRPYMTKCGYATLPTAPKRAFFHNMENQNVTLKAENGEVYDLKYSSGSPPRYQGRFYAGWPKFFESNQLKVGEACIFELLSSEPLAFKVTIKKKNEAPVQAMRALSEKRGLPRGIRSEVCDANLTAINIILERPGSFMICISQSYISPGATVYIPSTAGFRRFLSDIKHKENSVVFHGSSVKTWPVKYYFSASKSASFYGKGWEEFASDNHLQVGDICLFEIIKGKDKAFKVTIFQGAVAA